MIRFVNVHWIDFKTYARELHANSIVHKDLNPLNVVTVPRRGRRRCQIQAKIGNLRVATYISNGEYILSILLCDDSLGYAPEQRESTTLLDGFEVDIYSWTLMMYQCAKLGQGP